MSLLVYNLTAAPLVLANGLSTTIPASTAGLGARGEPWYASGNELSGRSGAEYLALQAQQAAGNVTFEWQTFEEYPTYALIVGQAPAQGNRIFFVDDAAGDDQQPGTSGAPYKTLARALLNFYTSWNGLAEIHVKGAAAYDMSGDYYFGKPSAPGAGILRIIGDDSAPATGAGTATTPFTVTVTPDNQNLTADLNAALLGDALEGALLTFLPGSANAGSTVVVCTNLASVGAGNTTAIFFGAGASGGATGFLGNPIAVNDTFTLTRPLSTITGGFVGLNDGAQVSLENLNITVGIGANTLSHLFLQKCHVQGGFIGQFSGAILDATSCYLDGPFMLALGAQPSRSSMLGGVMRGTVYLGFISWGLVTAGLYLIDSQIGGEELSPTTEIHDITFNGTNAFGPMLSFGRGSVYVNLDSLLFNAVTPADTSAVAVYEGSYVLVSNCQGSVAAGYFLEMYDGAAPHTNADGNSNIFLTGVNTVTGVPAALRISGQDKDYADLPFTGHTEVASGATASTSALNEITGLSGLTNANAGDIINLSGFATPGNNGSFKIAYVTSATSAVLAGPTGMISSPDANDGAGVWSVRSIAQPNNTAMIA